jgi:hypothetical protein
LRNGNRIAGRLSICSWVGSIRAEGSYEIFPGAGIDDPGYNCSVSRFSKCGETLA